MRKDGSGAESRGDAPGLAARALVAEAGREPGAEAGREPGAEAGREPGAEAGREPGAEAGREPGAEAGREPGAEAEREPGAEAEREPGLDALRGVAIVMVIFHHLSRSQLKDVVPVALAESWTGVDLFFVLSGFLVTRSFANWIDSSEPFRERVRSGARYVGRRFVRILGPAWFWAAVPLALSFAYNRSGAFGDPSDVAREALAILEFRYNYFLIHSDLHQLSPYWSLAVEEHFYLALPVLLVCASTHRRRMAVLIVIALACVAGRIRAARSGVNFGAINFLTHFRADGLAIGAILGLKASRGRTNRAWPEISHANSTSTSPWSRSRMSIAHSSAPVTVVSATVSVAIATLWIAPAYLSRFAVSAFGFLAFACLSAYLVRTAAGAKFESPSRGLRILAVVGRRSYSAYLIHLPLIRALTEIRSRTGPPTLLFSYAVGFEVITYCVLLATIVECGYRVIELPLVRLARSKFPSARATS